PAGRAPASRSSRAGAAAVRPSISPGPRPHERSRMHPRNYRLKFPEPAPAEPARELPGSSATPSVLRVRPASPPPKGPGTQPALRLEPRELWVAAHVPQLSLLAVRVPGEIRTLVVVDPEDHHQRIIDVDEAAQGAGVRPGMTLGAALAAVPHIEPRPR